ncbi:MAG TPA: MMPL family transporter, partial [Nocardioides sp.]|uniref:MMPL family transporter n=1 Tax=Nocardioides sp. TaxID=35761 RepID=UPI002D1B1228
MSHVLYLWGRWAARRPWVAIATWLFLAVAVTAASATVGHALDDTMTTPGSDSQAAADLLAAADTGADGLTSYVVATPRAAGDTFFDSARARAGLADLEQSLTGLPDLVGATDPAGMLATDQQGAVDAQMVSPDGRVALVRLQYPAIEKTDKSALAALKTALEEARSGSSLRLEAGGDLYFSFEEAPMSAYEAVGIVAALVILLVAFGSLVAAGLPLVIGLFALLVGTSALSLVAYGVDIPVWAPVMASMVGLGAGIDYALFLVTRHREYLAAGLSVPESVGRSVATAGQAVIFAGGTVVVAILGLAFAGLPFVAAGGVGIAVVVLVMVLAAITLLPALLGLAGPRINPHHRFARRTTRDSTTRRWTRWGNHVTSHPVAYLVGGTTLLLALAAPVTALRLGMPDEGSYPQARTERRAYDLIAEGFGPGAISPIVIAVDTAGDGSAVDRVTAAVAGDRGIVSARALPTTPGSDVAVVTAQATSTPQDRETQQTLARLRSTVLPDALVDGSASAHVGGYTAVMTDMSNRVQERLPIFLAAVVLLSCLLLVVLFRSPVVAVKAAILNLLSVGAAYGVLVAVFQWGWAKDLIGLEETVPIISFIPLFMFAILFGLSMDYEVFLLSRIREEYLRTGDNARSVVHGIGVTARTISAGAAIMVCVFGGFITGSDPTMKMLGLGLATAVLVDATVVRLVLVPATMALLGRANWWLPAWLDRRLPRLDADPVRGTPEV